MLLLLLLRSLRQRIGRSGEVKNSQPETKPRTKARSPGKGRSIVRQLENAYNSIIVWGSGLAAASNTSFAQKRGPLPPTSPARSPSHELEVVASARRLARDGSPRQLAAVLACSGGGISHEQVHVPNEVEHGKLG